MASHENAIEWHKAGGKMRKEEPSLGDCNGTLGARGGFFMH